LRGQAVEIGRAGRDPDAVEDIAHLARVADGDRQVLVDGVEQPLRGKAVRPAGQVLNLMRIPDQLRVV
jgi:hypothetical protein